MLWLVLLAAVRLVEARSLSAWQVDGAPQIIKYDGRSGNIFYSLCNGNGEETVFPSDGSNAFDLDIAPLGGTSVAATGYADDDGRQASISYLSQNVGIVQALYRCDLGTGHWVRKQESAEITGDIDLPEAVNRTTDLAALHLPGGGYRLLYWSVRPKVQTLRFDEEEGAGPGDGGGRWYFDGQIMNSGFFGPTIAAAFKYQDQITVMSPHVKPESIFISTGGGQGNWTMGAFPLPIWDKKRVGSKVTVTNETVNWDVKAAGERWGLEGFDYNATRLGLVVDEANKRNVFYVGNDSALHHVLEGNGAEPDRWDASSVQPAQGAEAWPEADGPNADLAVAYSAEARRTWVYYVARGGALTEARQEGDGSWKAARALPASSSGAGTTVAAGAAGGSAGAAAAGGGSNESVARDRGLGLGIGLGVGVPLLLAAAGICLWLLARRRRVGKAGAGPGSRDPLSSPGAGVGGTAGAGSPGAESEYEYGGYWQNGVWVSPVKPGSDMSHHPSAVPRQELPPLDRPSEAPGDGLAHEMPVVGRPLEAPAREPTQEMAGDFPPRQGGVPRA